MPGGRSGRAAAIGGLRPPPASAPRFCRWLPVGQQTLKNSSSFTPTCFKIARAVPSFSVFPRCIGTVTGDRPAFTRTT
jgi:hypothetical protein